MRPIFGPKAKSKNRPRQIKVNWLQWSKANWLVHLIFCPRSNLKIYFFKLQFNTMRACKGMNFGVQTSLLTRYIMSTSKSYYNPRNSQILWCYWYFTITLSSDQWTARHHTMTPTYLSVASLTMLAAVLSPKSYYLIFLDVIFLRTCRGLHTQCAHYLNII